MPSSWDNPIEGDEIAFIVPHDRTHWIYLKDGKVVQWHPESGAIYHVRPTPTRNEIDAKEKSR